MNKKITKNVRLVINTQPFYGDIELISTHETWMDACKAAVTYRAANPMCNTLEIYDHTPGNSSHSIESYAWKRIVANA